MPRFYQKIRNSGRNTGYIVYSTINTVVKQKRRYYPHEASVMHHPLEFGFTLIFMHFYQNSEVLSCCIQNDNKVFLQFIQSPDPYPTQQQSIFLSRFVDRDLLARHIPPHDKTLENHITFPKESENTTLSKCKHCCLNHECA